MTISQSLTDAGIRVVTEAMPSMRSASLGLWFCVGSRDEHADQWGCSHFLEHLLFKGTPTRSARAIAEELDAIGGEANAFTGREVTCFYARTLDRDLAAAADVLADMVRNATNVPDDVEAERDVVLEEINIHLDTPEDLVHSDLGEVLLPGHPLGLETLGSIASIEAMERDTIHAYFHERYRPERLVVAAAGNVTHDAVVALVEELLGDLGRPGGTAPERHAPTDYGLGRAHVRHRPTEQAHVLVGAPGLTLRDDALRPAFSVLNTILGGGMSSRLFQEIREARGLAYTTYSYSSLYTDAGIFGAYAGTTPGKVDELCGVLLDQLDTFRDGVTADEVARAKSAISGGMVLALEDTGSRMSRIGKLLANGEEIRTVDDELARVAAVDLDQVREVADLVLGRPRSITVVGPFGEDAEERFARYVA